MESRLCRCYHLDLLLPTTNEAFLLFTKVAFVSRKSWQILQALFVQQKHIQTRFNKDATSIEAGRPYLLGRGWLVLSTTMTTTVWLRQGSACESAWPKNNDATIKTRWEKKQNASVLHVTTAQLSTYHTKQLSLTRLRNFAHNYCTKDVLHRRNHCAFSTDIASGEHWWGSTSTNILWLLELRVTRGWRRHWDASTGASERTTLFRMSLHHTQHSFACIQCPSRWQSCIH